MKISNQLRQIGRDSISISDRFVIKQTIGKGTFGKVKLGIDKETNNKVAIKILEKNRILTNEDYERVKRELAIISKFSHQNVIQTYEIITSKDNYFIIMEYCEGGELFDHIVEKQRLSEKEAACYYYQLIKGLEYIHSHYVVHRDLKPENLLLGRNNMLKIIDFGLSNYYKGKLLKTPCGSPCYASPEMVSGNKYNGYYIDVWSTGIILFAMLCGYLPFEDDCNEILFQKILECRLDYPNHVSSDARGLLMKILVTNPEKRIKINEIKRHPFYLQGRALFNLEHNISSSSITTLNQFNSSSKQKSSNILINGYNKNNSNKNCNNENSNTDSNMIYYNCNTETGIKPINQISRNNRKKELSYNFDDVLINQYYMPIKTDHLSKNKTMENNQYNSNNSNYSNTNSNINKNEYYTVTSANNSNSTRNKKQMLHNAYHPSKLLMNYDSKSETTNETSIVSRNNTANGTNFNHFYFQDKNQSLSKGNKTKPLSSRSNLLPDGINDENSNKNKSTSRVNCAIKPTKINQQINKKENQMVREIRFNIGNEISDFVKTPRCNIAKANQKINYTTFRHSINGMTANIGLNVNTALDNKIIQEHKALSPKTNQSNLNFNQNHNQNQDQNYNPNRNSSSIPQQIIYRNFHTETGYNSNSNSNQIHSTQSPRMNNYINIDNSNKDEPLSSVLTIKKPETLYSDYLNSRRTASNISSMNQPIEKGKYVPSFNIHKDTCLLMNLATNTYNSTCTSNTNTNNNTKTNINLSNFEYKLNENANVGRLRDNPIYLTTEIQKNYMKNKKTTNSSLNTANKLKKILNSRNIQSSNDPLYTYSSSNNNNKKHLTSASVLPSSYSKNGFNTSLNYLKQQLKNMSRG